MVNVEKQVNQLRDGALEAWDTAAYLIKGRRIGLGLFALHLAVEKALKAHVIKETQDIPPFIHNLPKLAEVANLDLSERQKNLLADLNPYNIRGRYQEDLGSPPPMSEVKGLMKRAKEMFEWLIKKL
jgi:HEPN domain-containing protein